MTDIEKQWENYMELGERLVKEKRLKEEFEKEIKAFSSFLSETNKDFYYNSITKTPPFPLSHNIR